jgi:hypothetical protein
MVAVAVSAGLIYPPEMAQTELEAAAASALDDVVEGMGADICIWSVSLAIDEIASDLGTGTAEQERLRALLRTRFDLAV